jgi:hypothetical protein
MHGLLERQLRRHVGSAEGIPQEWQRFIEAVDEAYRQSDTDRAMLERSLDLTSQELFERNQQLQKQVETERAQAERMEAQGQALLNVIQSVARGDLDVMVEAMEGENVFTDLATGLEMMIDDIRGMMAEQKRSRAEIERSRQRLEEALFLMGERVKALDCLNDIGRRTDVSPPLPEFLLWVAERIPAAMRHSKVCLAAVEFEEQIYGAPEAMALPCQIVQGLRIGDELVGRVCIAYTKAHDFVNEESSLLGDIARRVGGYIESRRLLGQVEGRARREQLLREISVRVRGLTDPDAIVRAAVRELGTALGRRTFVRLGSAEQLKSPVSGAGGE